MEINVKINTEKTADVKNLIKMLNSLVHKEEPKEECEVCKGIEEMEETKEEENEENPQGIELGELQNAIMGIAAKVGIAPIKDLLSKYGVDKLSELSPSKYEELLMNVLEIKNATC